jgi:hypothetical protein
MTLTLVATASVAGLIQFVYYCRSALSAARKEKPSPQIFEIMRVDAQSPLGSDFERFRELAWICPEQKRDGTQMRAINFYYRVLGVIVSAFRALPVISMWAEREQQECSYFAAVVLERRISSSREEYLQQAAYRS